MLVLVQFAFADLRSFVGDAERTIGADWSLVPQPVNPDFVRGFGALRKRAHMLEGVWSGESWFAEAVRAIRFPPLTDALFARAGVRLVPKQALRRVFSDGRALWRVEIGLAFDPVVALDFTQILATVADLLALPMRARRRGAWGAPVALSSLGSSIGRALQDATTFKEAGDERRALELRPGRPMVFVETQASSASSMWANEAEAAVRTQTFQLTDKAGSASIDVDFGTLRIAHDEWPLVLLRSTRADDGRSTREVRTHLCRLHAEREVLTQVLRAANKGRITAVSGELERYFSRTQSALFADARHGIEQADLRQAFDVYDRITPAETASLVALLGHRRQSIERVTTLTATYRERDDRPIIHVEPGGHLTMNDNRVNVAGNNSGIINVAGTFTNTGNIIQGASNDEVKTALSSLKTLTEQLAAKLPEPAKQQSVANKLEALTKEATAAEPDHDMLKVTGKGLIEAAKTVAEMAAPIAKAVGVVLGIFGLVL